MKRIATPVRVGFALFFAGVLPLVVSELAPRLAGTDQLFEESLHEVMEVSGGCIALVVSVLLLLRVRHDERSAHLLWAVFSLVVMGLMDGIHAVTQFGVAWSWLRHVSTCLGGLLFGLIWLPVPAGLVRRRNLLVWGVALGAIGVSAAILIWPERLPVAWEDAFETSYSWPVRMVNAIGGFGYLSAAAFFFRRHLRFCQGEDLALASQTLLFGVAGVMFGFSHVWHLDWWIWHGARLLAYSVVLVAIYEMVVALYREIAKNASELEGRVQLRTAELSSTALFPEENPFPVIRALADGTITYANRPAEPVLQEWQSRRGEKVPQYVLDFIAKVRETGTRLSFEISAGSRSLTLVAVPIAGRDYINFYGADVTERRIAEEELRRSEVRLVQAVQVAELGTFDHDHVTGELHYSPVMRRLTGFKDNEKVTLEGFLSRVAPVDREALAEAIRQAHDPAGNGIFASEFRVTKLNGGIRWLSTRSQTFFDGEGKERLPIRTIGAALDVSEQKELHAKLERIVAERTRRLQQAVEELEHFSYTITHDMRAPLRAMQGFAEILMESCGDCGGGQCGVFLNRIRTSAERMDCLIRDALSYTKAVRQELPLETVDAGALLRGMLDTYPEFQSAADAITLEGEIPLIYANQAGLTQCFSNLLGNALKFVKTGERPRVRIWAEDREEWVRIWIEDHGLGIPASMLPQLFRMFARGHVGHEGTGIGLVLVRKVVERMGGKAGAESEEGKGSRFWVELKKERSPGFAAPSVDSPAPRSLT